MANEELISMLKDAGLSEEEAATKVKKLIDAVRMMRPEDSDEKIMGIVKLKVLQFANTIKRSGAKRMVGVVLGYDEYRDLYAGYKRQALEAYRMDPAGAVKNGLVKVEGNKIIPLDSRMELPNGEPNPRFGEPIPEIWRRNVFLSIEHELVRAIGDIKDEPEIGGIYDFAGITREDGTVVISKVRKFKKVGVCDDVFKEAEQALKPYGVEIEELLEWHRKHINDPRRIAAVRGLVVGVIDMANGGTLVIVDDIDEPTGDGVACFWNGVSPCNGDEVIAFGRTFENKDEEGNPRVAINAFGIIAKPSNMKLDELDDLLWE